MVYVSSHFSQDKGLVSRDKCLIRQVQDWNTLYMSVNQSFFRKLHAYKHSDSLVLLIGTKWHGTQLSSWESGEITLSFYKMVVLSLTASVDITEMSSWDRVLGMTCLILSCTLCQMSKIEFLQMMYNNVNV